LSDTALKRTPLYDEHVRLGARLVDFAGWEMPLLYRGINEEHRHTREKCSIFDVSHMGRIEVSGEGAGAFLEFLCTRRLGDMTPGQTRYSHVCNEQGGILDDVLVSRYETHWLVVCNGSNREKIVGWIQRHAAGRPVQIEDTTEATAMVAIQGPLTMREAARVLPIPMADLRRYHFVTGEFMGMRYTVSRTGYTGEDGLEVILPTQAAPGGWQFLLQPPDEFEPSVIQPAGLGARDTLRIEAGMPLYGHELHENIDSLQAGFAWCVDLSKDFCGAQAMRGIQAAGLKRRLVGLELAGKRIARHGYPVIRDGRTIGEVTSGTLAPTLGKSIAMAHVASESAEPGTAVRVRMRDHEEEAVIIALPFYTRTTKRQGDAAT
jgi:aminomethyltransferase